MKIFYGWVIVAVTWIIYGFGISPGYYSWGLFTPEILEELSLSRANTGAIFGVFTFIYSGIAPLGGIAISRWGVRAVMTGGSVLAALGFYLLSGADSMLECFLYYGILAGAGVGLSTILPAQTLATNWFVRYRARAVAIIFIAGGIVGRGVTRFDAWILAEHNWRDGWVAIAGVSLVLALLAALLIRNQPEDIGQQPDGAAKPAVSDTTDTPLAAPVTPLWTAGKAMRTPQFALMCFAGIGYAVPWGVVTGHGRLHLEDIGFETPVAASILGTMILVSILGRLTGSLGDFLLPERVLGIALLLEGAGVVGFLVAETAALAYASTIAIGIGFGAAYIAIAVVFSNFFGRAAFAKTAGTRFLITGVFNALGPFVAGTIFDATGSYRIAFLIVAAITLVGAVAALTVKPPQPVPAPAAA